MGTLWQEVRYGVRTLLKNPGFAAVAMLTLALGIGANAAIFSIVNAFLLRPLPYKDPGRLVRITGEFRNLNQPDVGLSVSELDDIKKLPKIFDGVAGQLSINGNLTGGEQPARVECLLDSDTYFSVLGVNPAMGRVFGPQDNVQGIGTLAVISDGAWRRRFGADTNIIGKQVRVDLDLYTIIGVMPPSFRHPGHALLTGIELWAPTTFVSGPFPNPPSREARFLEGAVARLSPAVSLAAAQARL